MGLTILSRQALKRFSLHPLARLAGRFVVIFMITFLLLELATRLIWWNERTIFLFDKQLALLPLPLLSETQRESLATWAQNEANYLQFDPVLGWSIRPDVTAEWEGHTYTSNSIGIRSLREYELAVPAGVTRIASFGPSFTHGDEVQGHETWQAQMEQARPDLEVMNWGVGGYGTDQAFLRYQTQGAAYHPQIVIIGFEEENVARNVNRFRPFYRPGTGLPLTKPLFVTDTHGLRLLENPFNTFDDLYQTLLFNPDRFIDLVCPHDLFCNEQRYRRDGWDNLAGVRFLRTLAFEMSHNEADSRAAHQAGEAEITLRLGQMFIKEIIQNQAAPLVVVFPEQRTMAAYEQGQLPAYYAGVMAIRDQGIEVIDLAGAFAEVKRAQNLDYADFYASEGGHYNAFGNQIVAQTIIWHLCKQGLLQNCS